MKDTVRNLTKSNNHKKVKNMYRPLKKHKLGKIFLFSLVLCMGIPIFLQPVKAGVDPGGDPPPNFISCWSQIRAYKGKTLWWDTHRFTFNVLASAHVYELWGGYKLGGFSSTWDKRDLIPWDEYHCDVLWYDYEFDYNIGGFQIVGFTRTVAFRIRDESGNHLDFELSACVHLWMLPDYRSVTCNLTEGGNAPWKLKIQDCTIYPDTLYITWIDLS